jgi:hypothetical protein
LKKKKKKLKACVHWKSNLWPALKSNYELQGGYALVTILDQESLYI